MYPKPSLYYDLFNINQFLFKAYNGIFPNTEAKLLKFKIFDGDGIEIGENWENLAKVIAGGLKGSCQVNKLFTV